MNRLTKTDFPWIAFADTATFCYGSKRKVTGVKQPFFFASVSFDLSGNIAINCEHVVFPFLKLIDSSDFSILKFQTFLSANDGRRVINEHDFH